MQLFEFHEIRVKLNRLSKDGKTLQRTKSVLWFWLLVIQLRKKTRKKNPIN